MTNPIGGSALPIVASTEAPIGASAQRVIVVSDGRPVLGGLAHPVYVVSQAEIDSGAFVVSGEALPIPVALVSDRPTIGGRPRPVVIVGDGPAPPIDPPADLVFQFTARSDVLTYGGLGTNVIGVADDYAQTIGLSATEFEAPAFNASGGPGGSGALVFDGAQRLAMSDALDIPPDSTLELWIYLDATGGFAFQSGVTKDLDASNYETNIYPRGGSGAASCYLDSAGAATSIISSVDPTPLTAWNYIVLRKDSTGWSLWLNGAEVGSAAYAPDPVQQPYPWQVGNSTLDEPLLGRVAQLALWSVAVSDAQIAARYAAGPRGFDGEGF